MNRSGSGDRARALQEATYEALERSFRASPVPMYGLRTPWLSPSYLGESHTVNGILQSVTLIYGSWDTDQPHVRVTTWRDLPGQDFVPDAPADLLAAPPDPVTVTIDADPAPGTLAQLPTTAWLLRTGHAPLHVLATGRGPIGELAFEPLTDLQPLINARRAYLASRRPKG
ncbi:hypothetical protein [Actinacidiphila acididurans]|uniref:Uncharacterized protein n=1 Tax=Actinacidiphila acididurans TaxID=2784346 RepID=A0ABS2TLT1_9ACTN|nr:hypothetical protein [Actinacidiphila acididurans]MBM9503767.1 hypothetical protein [Actinacidiphila acididurans]